MAKNSRKQIMERTFKAMHEHGFQGTRADKEILHLGITKGALYHHFPDKHQLGYAIVDELIAPHYIDTWQPLAETEEHPPEAIVSILKAQVRHAEDEDIRLGDPLTNLMNEMAPLDEGFRERLNHIVEVMRDSIEAALINGQKQGTVSREVNPLRSAYFILSSMQGAYGLAKTTQSRAVFEACMKQLMDYVEGLAE